MGTREIKEEEKGFNQRVLKTTTKKGLCSSQKESIIIYMNIKQKFAFIYSVRFWKVVIAITLESLISYGVIDMTLAVAVAHIVSLALGTSVTIRTLDRFSEKIGK